MSDSGAPKSAYELAMERLKKQDAEAGIETTPLTDAQKATIGEIRNFYQARIAEIELLHQSNMAKAFDPADQMKLDEEYRRDRERLTSERDHKVEKARRG